MSHTPSAAVAATGSVPLAVATRAAARAAAGGLAAFAALVLLGWLVTPGTASATDAVRISGQVWLAAHHTDFALASGELRLAPLGLAVVPALALARAGRSLGQAVQPPGLRSAARVTARLAVVYALFCGMAAFVAATEAVRPHPASAVAGGLLLGGAAGGVGVLRGAGLSGRVLERVPAAGRTALAAAAAATAVMVAGGSLLLAASLAISHEAVGTHLDILDPGPFGAFLLLLVTAAAVPNAVVCGTAYAAGPGFAVGAGTSVAPTGTVLGPLPAMPLLGALPEPGGASGPALLALAVPLAAGVVAGRMVRRGGPGSWSRAVSRAVAVGALTGLILGVLTALAGGPVADGRLETVGGSPVRVGVVTAVEVAVVVALTALPARLRRRTGDLEARSQRSPSTHSGTAAS